jgi:hypothetical protein
MARSGTYGTKQNKVEECRQWCESTQSEKACQWFSPGTPVSPTNITDIIEIFVNVVLITITLTLISFCGVIFIGLPFN